MRMPVSRRGSGVASSTSDVLILPCRHALPSVSILQHPVAHVVVVRDHRLGLPRFRGQLTIWDQGT